MDVFFSFCDRWFLYQDVFKTLRSIIGPLCKSVKKQEEKCSKDLYVDEVFCGVHVMEVESFSENCSLSLLLVDNMGKEKWSLLKGRKVMGGQTKVL